MLPIHWLLHGLLKETSITVSCLLCLHRSNWDDQYQFHVLFKSFQRWVHDKFSLETGGTLIAQFHHKWVKIPPPARAVVHRYIQGFVLFSQICTGAMDVWTWTCLLASAMTSCLWSVWFDAFLTDWRGCCSVSQRWDPCRYTALCPPCRTTLAHRSSVTLKIHFTILFPR